MLRQSFRLHGRVKTRTLADLSHWRPARIEALRGDFDQLASEPTIDSVFQDQFGVQELVFVGDRGMVNSQGKQALIEAGLHDLSALADPQIGRLLGEGTLPMSLFSEEVCEVEAEGVRYVLRKNEAEAARERHRLEDNWPS